MRRRPLSTALLVGMFAGPVLAAGAAYAGLAAPEPGTLRGGAIAQTGWWNSVNEPPPDNPVAPPPPPPAPDVPAGTLPVTVLAGEPRRLSAIEFALDGPAGAVVEGVQVSLRENKDPNLTANADGARIQACAVTEAFWVGGENNPWKNRPDHDCKAGSAKGVRDAATGIWTFDLTALASEWKSEDFTGSPSVVLVGETAGANGEPLSFQVVFDGVQAKGIGLLATTSSAGSGSESLGDSGSVPGSGGLGGVGGSGDTGSSLGDAVAGALPADVAGADLGAPDLAAVDPGAAAVPEAAAAPVAAAGTSDQLRPVSATSPWYDGLFRPAALLLPLVLVLAYTAMLAMGPQAQPTGVSNRRGVSRALDRLRGTGAALAARVAR